VAYMNTQEINNLVRDLAARLAPVYPDSAWAQRIAWRLLEHVTGKPRTALITRTLVAVSAGEQRALETAVVELVEQHKPLAYILGTVEFLGLTLAIEPPTLIPRNETEQWVGALVARLQQYRRQPLKILDLCTGSGCIALALAHQFPLSSVLGVDIAPQALELARRNARKLGLTNVVFIASDLYNNLDNNLAPASLFDLIVTNPPYIAPEELASLEPSVARWEDPGALIAQDNGLALIKRIICDAPKFLNPQSPLAQVWIEIGHTQTGPVSELMSASGFSEVQVLDDLAGIPRVVIGK